MKALYSHPNSTNMAMYYNFHIFAIRVVMISILYLQIRNTTRGNLGEAAKPSQPPGQERFSKFGSHDFVGGNHVHP